MVFIFDINENNELLQQYYRKDNFKIMEFNLFHGVCFIFFSGNGLFYPNIESAVRDVMRKDRYEWENISKLMLANNISIKGKGKKKGKMIFLRDIFIQWYLSGINNKTDNIDELKLFLEQQTKGYKIITVGNSAGGYMASLMGALLNAKLVFSFSGQFSIRGLLGNNPHLDKYKYYDILKYIKNSKTTIFYFFPAYSRSDVEQYELTKGLKNIYAFGFNERNHGATFLNINMPYILKMNKNRLIQLHKYYNNKIINKYCFLFKSIGLFKGFYVLIKKEIEPYKPS